MKEYINSPCNSSLATSCVKSAMASSCDEGKVAAPFTEGVSSSTEGCWRSMNLLQLSVHWPI